MNEIHITEVWAAAALVIGFQLLAFSWRLDRELKLMDLYKEKQIDEPNWFPLGDYLNLLSMLVLISKVFIYYADPKAAASGLTLSLILLAGYPFTIIGHYWLFTNPAPKDRPYCTWQEALCIIVTLVFATWFAVSRKVFYHTILNWLLLPLIAVIVGIVAIFVFVKSKKTKLS